MNKNYWIGPYEILVPNNVYFVIAEDGENTIDKWGGYTNLYYGKSITRDEYIAKYCYLGNDGNYYYDVNHDKESCCVLL
jgi:hypothetical protein